MTRFWIEVKLPATNTRLPTISRSQISPSLINGVLVRGTSGTSRVWPGGGCGAERVTVRVVLALAPPSLTVRVMVRDPAAA